MNFRRFFSAYKILYFFKAIKDRKGCKINTKYNKNALSIKKSTRKHQSK